MVWHCYNLGGSLKRKKKKKKPFSKGDMLYDSLRKTFSEWQNYRDGNRLVTARGQG